MKSGASPPFRLVIVSNRGPYLLHVTPQRIRREKTIGGLVTSLPPMIEEQGGVWIAWGEPAGRYALWPLCHYFLGRVHYDDAEWQVYEQVNAQFAQATLEEATDDAVLWVHDYHLALVPGHLRRERPNARIAFFWHIPFPAAELFRTLPWREGFMESLLTCDLIGFHIPEYAENFIETAVEVLGARAEGDCLYYAGRTTRVLARPIGIDYHAVNREARSPRTEERVRRLRQTLDGQKLILGVERMDYTKGICERLQAMERLLERQSELHGAVSLIQIVTPSRMGLAAYRQKKREIDEIVGRINGRFSDGFWMPVRYLYRPISPAELIAYYRAADIALVTPFRDGLNLVAKEYVAARVDGDGVLILSEFAGVARQLPEALLVNPYNIAGMVTALQQALEMPPEDQRRRMLAMQERIQAQDISWWAKEFLGHMTALNRTERA